ncbi:TetR/AcrR family transcriptional regulator [Actinomycetospora endophytica]|uniref:TetR/AcrR family transcriptional regulator n=1 Tax=Actinomycetospora endophytica TaxID=2291215 RepID=A0ABS8PCD6_9PSEU|nr:TetR/AcrR family transcriptional regulator [Actinomycetospora endophytica]MCD2195951.1 TetR/AcrR family transcriptional regulator [Actinomycetospora endophytica]
MSTEATREAILAGAVAVFARRGVDAASIGELAEAAGVTRPTVYAHFGAKNEIFRALAHRVRDEVLDAQAVTGTDDPAAIARTVVTDYLDLTVRHLRVLELLAARARTDPDCAALQVEILDRVHRRNTRFVARLAADGLADPVIAPEQVSEAITGIVRRFAEIVDAAPERRSELAEAAVAAYLRLGGLSRARG